MVLNTLKQSTQRAYTVSLNVLLYGRPHFHRQTQDYVDQCHQNMTCKIYFV